MAYADPFGSFIDGFRQGEADARKAAGESKRARGRGGSGGGGGDNSGRSNDDLIPNAPIKPALRPGDPGFVPLPRPPGEILGDQNPSRGYGETEGPGADATPFDAPPALPPQTPFTAPEDQGSPGVTPAPAARRRAPPQTPFTAPEDQGSPGVTPAPLPQTPFTMPEDQGSPGVGPAPPRLEDVLDRLPPPPFSPPDNVAILRQVDRAARQAGRLPFWVPTQRTMEPSLDPFGRVAGPPREIIRPNPDYEPPVQVDPVEAVRRFRRETILPEIRRRARAGQLTREQFNYLMRYMAGDPDMTSPFEDAF
jgi:hypothetical protein